MSSISQALKKEFQDIMLPKSKMNSWPASNQLMEFQQVAATEWLYHAWPQKESFDSGLSAAWLTTLVKPGEVVVCKSLPRLVLVLAKASFAFAGWDLQIWEGSNGDVFRPVRSMGLHWHFVHDLEDWLNLPVKPGLAGPHGPMQLVQVGEPLSLPMARIKQGLSLSCQQAKDLLKLHQVPFKGNASRATLHMLLLDFFLGLQTQKRNNKPRTKWSRTWLPKRRILKTT